MFRTAYNREEHKRVVHKECDREKRAQQQFREDCNINSIMKRFRNTGIVTHGNPKEPQYFDCPAAPDYQESLNTVIAVQEHFEALPAGVRQRFRNDPVAFLEFVQDDKNADEIERLGLMSEDAIAARREARKKAAAIEAAKKEKAARAASEGD